METKLLESSWKATSWGFAGQVVLVIDADNPQVMTSKDGMSGSLTPCEWVMEGDKLTVTVAGLTCTFDVSFDGEGRLVLANASPADSILAGYAFWGPFERADG